MSRIHCRCLPLLMLTVAALRKELRPTVRLAAPLVLGRNRLDGDGHRRYHHGRTPAEQRRRHGSGQSRLRYLHCAWAGLAAAFSLASTRWSLKLSVPANAKTAIAPWSTAFTSASPSRPSSARRSGCFLASLARSTSTLTVLSLAIPYTKALTVGLLPLLLYFALRRCLQAMNMVKPVAFALVTANIINALFNWILIYGHWGAPAMGTVGSGWSTAIARSTWPAVLVGYLLWYDHASHRTS